MSKAIYLGKAEIGWCDNCNVPVLGDECGICHSIPRTVKSTPPGDFRFAMKGDLALLDNAFSHILNKKFSEIFSGHLILLNRIPGVERSEEIIVSGHVISTVIYEINGPYIVLRPELFLMAKEHLKDIFVYADCGAVESIKNGNNLMVPGILKIGKDAIKDGYVFVLDCRGELIGTGILKIDNLDKKNGVGVKMKHIYDPSIKINMKGSTIDMAIDANKNYMEKLEKRAIEMLSGLKNNEIAVSFSGGKDSLVALHLAIKSGLKFKTLFLNTGIEFPETVEYVKNISKKYNLDLDIIDAGDAFFRHLDHFGPPGRDYRWCCKVCKLGPTTRYIREHYGNNKIYMVIGQRGYESETRHRKGSIWINEWVLNQIGVSPIQNWNSLSIWLYIFKNKLEYNPWYDRGLWRTGCYLCPSQDLMDLKIVEQHYENYKKWNDYLENYAKEKGLPEEWVKNGLWRWNNIPEHLNQKNIKFKRTSLKVFYENLDDQVRIKWNKNIEEKRILNMLNILPKGVYEYNNDLVVKSKFKEMAEQIIYQAGECVGCGVCTGRCDRNALIIKEGKVWVDEEKCIHCTKCLGKCPAYNFR